MKPIIAILCSKQETETGSAVSKINLAYVRAVEKNGGLPLLIPYGSPEETVTRLLEMARGLLLPGGVDVDPARYAEEPIPELGSVDPGQDSMDFMALRLAEERELPVLGICRGIQSMNVYGGGSLWQDISTQIEYTQEHARRDEKNRTVHLVTVEEDSVLRKWIGEATLAVNSSHHQSVKTVAEGFTVSARSEDGVIEAIEGKNGRWIGVQWHPEELLNLMPDMNNLFLRFIELARGPEKETTPDDSGKSKKSAWTIGISGWAKKDGLF